MSDPNRPGYTQSGYKLPQFDAAMLERQKQAAIGGAAGGAVFAGLQLALPQDPNAPLPPTQTAAPSATAPNASAAAQMGAGANQVPAKVNDPLEASFQRALGIDPAAARSARAPILQGVPDANLQPNQAGVGQPMSDPSQTPLTPGERAPADKTALDAIAGVTAAPAQTITGSNAQMGAEMPVPSPTAEAGAGTGAMVQPPQVGDVVNYEGYAGRLQQDGPRLVVEVPNGPVVEVADLAGVQHAAGDTVQQVRMAELRTMPDPQVSETKFMPAGNGTLSLRDNTGNTYVPHNDQLLRSVRTNEQGGVEVLLRNPKRPGQVIKLTGKQAEQAQEAILEAAINVEQQGGTVRYGTSRGMQNLKGGNRGNAGSTTLPGAAADALVNLANAAVRAGQTFAQWAKTMVQRFGEAVRKYLQGAWQAAMQTSEVGAVDIFNGRVRGMTTSATEVLHNDSAALPKPESKVSNDSVAKNLQEAALEQWGEIITSDSITPEQEAILVANGTEEFVAAFKASGKTAADWYTTNIESAMAVANVIHEELKSDQAAQAVRVNGRQIFRNKEDAQLALYLAMAVTSQNLNVNQNTTYAEEQFQIFKATGKFDASRLYGEKAKSISANLDLANNVLKELGWQDLHDIIKTTYTVRELSSILSKWTGKNLKIAGRMEDQVQGAAIFGPKIGQGFLQNLMGNYLPVTIDLWMRRTWGRWTGDVLGDGITGERLARLIDTARDIGLILPASLTRARPVVRLTEKGKPFRTMSEEFLDRLDTEEELRDQLNDYAKEVVAIWGRKYKAVQSGITKTQLDGLLAARTSMDTVATATVKDEERLNRQWEAKTDKPKGAGAKETWKNAQRAKNGRTSKLTTDQWNGTVNGVKNVEPKLKPQWALAANVIRTQLKPIDAPSDQDRAVISRIVNKIRVELEGQGITVSNADIQAVLWYPEKDLWAKLRGEEESNLKQSYEDEFLQLARERGLGTEGEAAAGRVRAARTGGATDQIADGGIRQGSVRIGETQGGGFKNLSVSGRTAGFLNTDILNEAADLIRQGITDFANWSKAMLTRFGRAIQEFLAGIWQQVANPQTNAAQNVRMGMARGTAPVTLSNSGAVLNPAQVSPTLQPAVKQTNVLKQMFSAVPKFTAFRGALNGWIGRSQTSTLAVNHLMTELEKRVPDVTQRIGITNWIQAAGDDTVLAAREAKSMGKTRAGYTAARNLSPVALTEAQRVASFYERALAHAKANGLEVNALENYVNQVWQKPGVSGHRAFAQFTGNLTRSFKFGQQRKIESFFEGEQKGLTPATKDISKLMGLYLTEMNKTLSTRQLIAELTQTAAQDGRPLAMPMGAALPTQDGQPGEITLILPGAKGSVTFQGAKHDTGDFVRLNHPALAKWKMAANDTEGNPVMVLGELALHPEAAGIMTAALGRSKLREFYDSASDNIAGTLLRKAIKTVDVLQSQIKASMMSLSPFHIVQEGTHAVGHKVNPFSNIPTVDPADPAHVDAMNHGLMLASESHGMEAFMDGLTGRGSWMEKIPGIGQLIQRIGDFTFSHYIPGLKLKTYDHILARNTVRFDAEMKAGTVTLDDVKYLSAKQTNGAYGHLNYKDMGRDPTIQHLLRAVLLAPDFLEARARFTGQAIQGITGKVGREQAVAMATLAVTFWVAARLINAAMNDGDWKPEEPFGVVVGNRTYTMRSVPEDIYRLFHRPQQFVAGRVAPVIGTGFMEGLYGLNYRGEKVGGAEALQDVLTNAIPMSIRMVPGIDKLVAGQKNRPVNAWEQFLGSLGLQIGRHSPITELQSEAHKFAVASGADERGSYPVSKFQQLRYALEDLDWEKASGEIKGLLKLKNNRGELSDNFKSSLFRHWTVNSAMDVQWKASLKPDQRALMQHAEARRLEVWQRFRKLLAQ